MSDAYQFAIGRPRALLAVGCLLAAVALLFFVGTLSGILYANRRAALQSVAVSKPAVKLPHAPAMKPPEVSSAPSPAPKPDTAPSAELAAPAPELAANTAPAPGIHTAAAPTMTSTVAPPAATASAKANDSATPSLPAMASATSAKPATAADAKAQSAANPAPAIAATSYAVPLAVRVGSFAVESKAETLMQSLKDLGYLPALTRSIDARGRSWYVVELGPYMKWNAASKVASRISIAENVTPIIRPMR